ncbi:MAG: substrate-binding domain-containing protein [Chloroflexi bacterium]|nr:substrate-binding domain-containing protein [Chloroflexota bacterium]
MEAHKRRQTILNLIEKQGEVTVEELAANYNVSANTIRNDLNALAAKNQIRRVHGGAALLEETIPNRHQAFAARADVNREAKEQIGQWAASLIQNGDAIVLDASSTVYHLATHLQDHQNLTVVTNGLQTAQLLAQNLSNTVILAANIVRPDGFSVIGNLDATLRDQFFASKCFVSCSGFSMEQGLTEVDVNEIPLKSDMSKLARQVIALVDHTKFGKVDTYRFAALEQIDHLATTESISAENLTELKLAADFPITLVGDNVHTIKSTSSSSKKRHYKIGFGNLSHKILFAQQVQKSLEQAAERIDTIELLYRDNNLDRQAALDNADWFVAQEVDLVIEYHVDAKAGNVIMDKLTQANIPTIAVDIPFPGATFYGANNYRAGYIAGEGLGNWITQNWQGHLDILLKLESSRVGPVVDARLQGQQEGLEAVIGSLSDEQIITIDSHIIADEVELMINDLLPSLNHQASIGIVGLNDDIALGALTAFEKAGFLDRVVAVGQGADLNAIEALRRSKYPFIGSTRYAPEHYGEQLLDLALKILSDESVPPAVYNEHIFITKNNVDEYYPQSKEKIFQQRRR